MWVVFIFSCVSYAIVGHGNQFFIDNVLRSILSQLQIECIPLKGGSNAQVSRVTIKPSSCVLRQISDKASLEECIRECTITSICSEQGIGPRVYVADPARKAILAEYVQDQGIPRDQFGTQQFLHNLGSLIQRLHTLNVQDIERIGSIKFNCSLQMGLCNLFVINKIEEAIDCACDQLVAVNISPAEVKKLVTDLTQKLSSVYTPDMMVLSHGDLHWGNCLYAQDRIWLIDYETSGLAPWWYDMGVVGAHVSLSQESDDYLLEGYFDNSKHQITAEEKTHYLWMKHAAMIFYAMHRLSQYSLEAVLHAHATYMDLAAIQNAYKNGTFSLDNEHGHALLALAMIHSVLDSY
jgi:tRNA A-37 threonylcarbamoyl transferase component Bud32